MKAADDLVDAMLRRVRPTRAEEEQLHATVDKMVTHARNVAKRFRDEGLPSFEPLVVGSAAKDTWLAGSVDIDLFLLFESTLERARLEELGLRAGKEILPDWNLRYAEHPYVTGTFDDYEADVVPAYRVASATQIQSAVDRTPFHNTYVQELLERTPERRDDIRLMKAWLKGIGVYGAETALGGLSGYLTEVLTLHHGGFLSAVEAFADYAPGTRIDPADHSDAAFPDDVLVVIDPVDPGRNAASAVRAENLERLQAAASDFLGRPNERFFDPAPLPKLDATRAGALIGDGAAVLVVFAVPDMREDAIIPHLRRSAETLGKLLGREGFHVLQTAGGTTADDARAYLFVRTAEPALPATRLHRGPPVDSGQRAAEFRAKYADHPDVIDPVHEIEEHGRQRLAVALRVQRTGLHERVQDILSRRVSLGKHTERAIQAGAEVVAARDAVAEPDLERVLAGLLCPLPPWARTGDPDHDYALSEANSGASG